MNARTSVDDRPLRVLFVGNPNVGKSTLFNGLTGANASVGNFPGTTVGRTQARLEAAGGVLCVAEDLPGTYSMAARSPEERIAIDAVLGSAGLEPADLLLLVCDASRLSRGLYLALQLLEFRVPTVIVLNMMDEARAAGVAPDPDALSLALGVPVVAAVGRTGEGLGELRAVIATGKTMPCPGSPVTFTTDLQADIDTVVSVLPERLIGANDAKGRAHAIAAWLLLSVDGPDALMDLDLPTGSVEAVREAAAASGRDVTAELVGQRFMWIDAHLPLFCPAPASSGMPVTDVLDRWLLHPVIGTLAFLSVMSLVFQALFAWSDPAIGAIEGVFETAGDLVTIAFDAVGTGGIVEIGRDFVVEGLIGGVGSVLVFLPQIGLLFLFLALLDDCGYLARAAHLMDRILRMAGLPGRAFVPLLSGFACAVPAVMATRTMPRFRDRLLTMMVIPLTSCSARLPVYALIIAALFPAELPGWPVPVRPAVMFGMYLFSTIVTVLAAVVLGNTVLKAEASSAVLEMPPYRWPSPRNVYRAVVRSCRMFVREAGGIILVATVLLWALLSFPKVDPVTLMTPEIELAVAQGADADELLQAEALAQSYGGRLGKAIEPMVEPLGFDWRIGVGIIGSFAAREVFVSTMGLVYGIGEGADEESEDLWERMRSARRPDGTPVYSPLVGLSLMVFFALALQCTSTLAVLRRETGGWKWPLFIFSYMSTMAWVASFLVVRVGTWLGLG